MEKVTKNLCGYLRYKFWVYDLRTVTHFAFGAVHNTFLFCLENIFGWWNRTLLSGKEKGMRKIYQEECAGKKGNEGEGCGKSTRERRRNRKQTSSDMQ